MRRVIAALIAGLVLGATGVAGATVNSYWEGRGAKYHCEGETSGVKCVHNSGYVIWFTPGFAAINKGRKPVAYCVLREPTSSCWSR